MRGGLEKRLVNYSIILMGLALFVFVLKTFQSFIRPFIIASILSVLLVPLIRLKGKRKNVFLIVSLLFFTCILLSSIVLPYYINSGISGFAESRTSSEVLSFFYKPLFTVEGNIITVGDIFSEIELGTIFKSFIRSSVDYISSIVREIIFVLLFLVFLIPSYYHYYDMIKKSKKKSFKRVLKTLLSIENGVREYLKIKSGVSFLTAFLSGILLYVFGSKFVLFFAFLIFILNFIPNIGSILAVFIAIMNYYITYGYSPQLLILMVFLIIIQFVVGNIIEPEISGNKLRIPPIVILLSLFFWGSVWGLPGMFLAVPLTYILKIVYDEVRIH